MIETKELTAEELDQLQKTIDVDKWLASERAGRDLCGEASYCVYCIKAETYPCARAVVREQTEKEGLKEIEEAEDEIAVAEEPEEQPAIKEGYELVTRFRRSYKSRLIQSATVQELYSGLKNAVLGYAGVKCRIGFQGETYRVGKQLIAKSNISGKTLCLYLALNPADFEDSKFRFEDVSDKKTHAAVPMKVRIPSRRALKHAQELLKILAEKYELQEVGTLLKEYKFPYETDEQLIEDGLIKPYTVLVKKKKKS